MDVININAVEKKGYILRLNERENVCFWKCTEIRGWVAKDSALMPGWPSTKASWALYFQSKPCSHQYYFSLPSFGYFCFFSRFPVHKPGGCWLASDGPDYCLSNVFAVALVFPHSPGEALVLLACWKSACLGIVRSYILSGNPVLINISIKRDWSKVR